MTDAANKVADALLGVERYQCNNCEWKTNDPEAVDALGRRNDIDPGEIMPFGQCPECGSTVDCPDAEIPSYTIAYVIQVLRDRGFEIKEPVK